MIASTFLTSTHTLEAVHASLAFKSCERQVVPPLQTWSFLGTALPQYFQADSLRRHSLQTRIRRRISICAKGDKDLLTNIAEKVQGEEVGSFGCINFLTIPDNKMHYAVGLNELPAGQDSQEAPRKGFGSPQQKPKAKKKASEDRPFQVQNPLNNPPSQADEWEANIVRVLALLFVVFFCEGIFLAIAVSSRQHS